MSVNLLTPGDCDEDCYPCIVQNPCELTVNSITVSSANACMQAFIGTWPVLSSPGPISPCLFDCYEISSSFEPEFDPDGVCSFGGFTYRAWNFTHIITMFTNGEVWVRLQFVWRYSLNPVLTAVLRGRMYSSDGGITFGAFQIDQVPPGCNPASSDSAPTDGSDIGITVDIV